MLFSKKKKKGGEFGDTKKHKHRHHFECNIVRVLGIEAFQLAGSLLNIIGHRWNRRFIGHGVADLEILCHEIITHLL